MKFLATCSTAVICMQNVHRKFQKMRVFVPGQSKSIFTRYVIPCIKLFCMLYESIKVEVLNINLCFLPEQFLS